MPRALIHQSSPGLPTSPNRRRATPGPCGLRSYPTTEVVRARTRARSLNSSGTLSRGRAAGDRPHMGGVHEVQRKRQFRREGLCLLGADLQTGGTACEDADPRFRSRNVKLTPDQHDERSDKQDIEPLQRHHSPHSQILTRAGHTSGLARVPVTPPRCHEPT